MSKKKVSNNQKNKRSYRGYSKRKVNTRDPRKTFLIVCEGEKTEPNYFRSFRVPREVVDIRGIGQNTVQLVKKAIDLQNNQKYDQTWCVLDRDEFPEQNFNKALKLAKESKIKVAYSNEAFELWYLLHFNYYDTKISRQEYCKKLSEELRKVFNCEYKKNSDTLYEKLESRQQDAIKNSERLLKQYHPPNPARDNPSTTVHLLVQQLNRFVR